MTFTHDDIQSRLIEFLYGELEGDARAAFEAHLADCERCRVEVAQFQKTRDVARAAVRAGLEDQVPAGVRARLLEAAAAARAQASATAGAATAARAAVGARKPSPPKSKGESAGPFAWLRARWAVPMFVTVAAMGALLLVRETIYREARKPLGESPAFQAPPPAPADQSAEPKVPAEPPPAAPAAEKAAAPAEDARQPVRERSKIARRRAPAETAAGGGATRAAAADQPAAKGKDWKAKGSTAEAAAKDDSIEGLLSGAETRKPAKRAISDDLLGGLADKNSSRGFAQPPPPRAVAAPRAPGPAAPPAPKAAAKSSVVMDTDDGAEAAQTKQQLQRQRTAVAQAPEAEAAPPQPAAAPAVSRAESDEEGAPPDAAASLAARAEKLMASRQWVEAAAAYRQLIARFPKHEQVPNWRRRLAIVEAAAARATYPSK